MLKKKEEGIETSPSHQSTKTQMGRVLWNPLCCVEENQDKNREGIKPSPLCWSEKTQMEKILHSFHHIKEKRHKWRGC